MYQTEGPDLDGNIKKFEKPWFSVAIMFVSMACCLPLAPLQEQLHKRAKHQRAEEAHEPLLSDSDDEEVHWTLTLPR